MKQAKPITSLLLACFMGTLSGFAQNPAVQYEQDILIREYQLLNKLVPKNSLTIRPYTGRKAGDSLSTDSVFTYFDPKKLKQDFMPDELFACPLRI